MQEGKATPPVPIDIRGRILFFEGETRKQEKEDQRSWGSKEEEIERKRTLMPKREKNNDVRTKKKKRKKKKKKDIVTRKRRSTGSFQLEGTGFLNNGEKDKLDVHQSEEEEKGKERENQGSGTKGSVIFHERKRTVSIAGTN